jgi:hypothetical protein
MVSPNMLTERNATSIVWRTYPEGASSSTTVLLYCCTAVLLYCCTAVIRPASSHPSALSAGDGGDTQGCGPPGGDIAAEGGVPSLGGGVLLYLFRTEVRVRVYEGGCMRVGV